MDSQLHSPQAVYIRSLVEGIKCLASSTNVETASGANRPAAIGLRLNRDLLIHTLGLRISQKATILLESQVSVQMPEKC